VRYLARLILPGAHLLDRLAAIGDLHQLGGAAGADAELGLEQLLPLSPVAGVLLLERRKVLTGGDLLVVLGSLGGLIARSDVRLDGADQLRLIRGRGFRIVGVDLAGEQIDFLGLDLGRHRGGAQILRGHSITGSASRNACRSLASTMVRLPDLRALSCPLWIAL